MKTHKWPLHHRSRILFLANLFTMNLSLTLMLCPQIFAQVTPTVGVGNLNTQVTEAGNVYEITQGTRAGPNLFHSFNNFSITAAETARFQTTNLVPDNSVGNILGRVTGGAPSNILGTIDSISYYPTANLFLMNPAGFLFGPNATVNVGGMVAFTSADYLRLADGVRFSAVPSPADALLSTAPLAAFGFLGSNPGAITVQGSQFAVSEGQGISLVGGNITIEVGALEDTTVQPARLSAPSGQINLASVASPGEVLATNLMPEAGMTRATIDLSQGSTIDVSGEATGTIRIRGGQLELLNSALNADTGNLSGAETAIDIQLTETLSISSDSVPALTARSFGDGNAGAISVSSPRMEMVSLLPEVVSLIDTHTEGAGNGGSVILNAGITGELLYTGNPGGFDFFIMSGTAGIGDGGDVTINAGTINLQSARIDTGDAILGGLGSGGHITFTGGDMNFDFVSIVSDSLNARGGDILLNGRDISIVNNSQIGPLSLLGESTVTIYARNFALKDGSIIFNQTALGTGGGITITSENAEFRNGSSVFSQTSGDADAGFIKLFVAGNATFADSFDDPTNPPARSGLFSNSLGDATLGTHGNAGAIDVSVGSLTITGGARIDSTTQTNGKGGAITITAAGEVSITGERPLGTTPERRASGIYTRTIGSELCAGPCGDAGNVTITSSSLNLGGGGTINSDTTNNGVGGNITVSAANTITVSGTMIDGTPSGIFSRTIGPESDAGAGGNITLTAGQSVTISNGASVSASSTGPGNAGNISINAGQQFEMLNSSVKTEAVQARGGNIEIQAIDQVRLVNSSISTSVIGGSGSGGNITIDPNVVVLQNSNVITQAVQGAGGNITITTPLFLADSSSLVSASSQFGLNGTVTIQSPTSNLSGSLGTLASKPSQAQSLLTQRCAALANGQASSFVVAGREQLPSDPGSWLSSPLAFAALGESLDAGDAVASAPAVTAMATHDTDRVSLRRLTPAGFLIANFADSEATGCHS